MTAEPQKKDSGELGWGFMIGIVVLLILVAGVYIACGMYAAHLSWKCNVDLKAHVVIKILAVISAFLSGPFYVSFYMLSYHSELCYFASQLNAGALPIATAAAATLATPAVATA